MKPQIVIDLETLDVQPSAAILTVAAVEIDPTQTGEDLFRRSFFARVELPQPGRTLDQQTAEWWKAQSAEAYADAFTQEGREDLGCVVIELNHWLAESDAPIWGNGSDFDNAILRHAFGQHGLAWPYRRNRCLRSLRGVLQDLELSPSPTPEFEGVKHRAMDDARHEARELAALLHALTQSTPEFQA